MTDWILQASIGAVWSALGGPPLRHGRGQAWWRDGDGHNVAVDEPRGVWHDHARGEGGGILDLIQRVLDSDRRVAVQWLADHLGVTLDREPMSPSERRQWARRRAWAEREADKLTAQWQAVIEDLRGRRNQAWDNERAASRLALRLLREGRDDSPLWDLVWRHALDDVRGDALDRELQRVESLSPSAFRLEVAA